jgi:ferredoxin
MKRKYVLTFPPKIVTQPITYRLVKDFDLVVNILRAQIEEGETGHLVLELEGSKSQLNKGLAFLSEQGVHVQPLAQDITLERAECVDCGLCIGVCPTQALYLDKKWQLNLDKEKCILCENCVKACPVRVIEVAL